MADLAPALADLLGPYLARQRWYAGTGVPGSLEVLDHRELCTTGERRHLHWALVRADGDLYQLLIGQRPAGEEADFLSGHEAAVIGNHDDAYYYDGALDPELSLRLLGVVTAGVEFANRVRPVGVEQSNTSLVYDERIIVKLFRRLADGPNPDVVTTNGLAAAGFTHVATPVATWRSDGRDLAFAQAFLAGGTEGWALALTSLRDYYHGESPDPADAGGDFSGEASRLGRVTAELHLAMRVAWGHEPELLAGAEWAALVDDIQARLERFVADPGDAQVPDRRLVDAAIARLRVVADPGPAQRVHGDYHLGQVMRTDGGWYVLDFEGEPARPAAERLAPSSPYKDVTGMLRSLDYAARFALRERSDDTMAARADRWEAHNRDAFTHGYLATAGIDELLPPPDARPVVLGAYELDKALYELAYEQAYRPEWIPIPAGALARILARLA